MNAQSDDRYIALPPNPGGMASIHADNNVCVERTRVRNVGVADLADVVEYRIAAIVDSVSHYVRFCNGGELYYVFNRRGEVVELTGRAVNVSISPEGDYVFGALIRP